MSGLVYPPESCPHEETRVASASEPVCTACGSTLPGPAALLAHWALPLLARARRFADEYGDTDPGGALLADDIAAFIGHSVTDQPPADELTEVLAQLDPPAITSDLPGRRGTREFYEAVTAKATPCWPQAMVHSFHPDPLMRIRQGFDTAGHPPNCGAYREPSAAMIERAHAKAMRASKSREPAPPVEETREPAPCDCGAMPGQGHLLRCAVWA